MKFLSEFYSWNFKFGADPARLLFSGKTLPAPTLEQVPPVAWRMNAAKRRVMNNVSALFQVFKLARSSKSPKLMKRVMKREEEMSVSVSLGFMSEPMNIQGKWP